MHHRIAFASFLALTAFLLAGCPKREGNAEFKAGKQAELNQDYDSALIHYDRALRSDPANAEYKLRATQMRFQAGQFHLEQGKKALAKGDLQLALAEFQKAHAIDPSNAAAEQQTKRTMELIAAQRAAEAPAPARPPEEAELLSAPPELKPLSREPINLKMTNEARIVFDTIAKLAGLTVIFDPDFQSRRISIELPNVTLEQALDAVAIESKAFWKPVTSNIILVAPDQPQKRRDFEDQVVRTFYLSNTLTPQDLTEIVTGLRQLLDLKRVQQVNSQNAIVIRDTPDKLILASKIIHDIDKAKPEVLVQVQVLEASLDRVRDLGIEPGQSAVVTFTPRTALQPSTSSSSSSSSSSSTSTTTTPQITLNNLKRLSTADYSITLPGAAATALLTDSTTKIIQNPEIRVSDGQTAKVRIGDRVPIASGSFQAGVGVGVGGGAGVINPLVNTQFQYIDVGVNIDVTPRVHPDAEISMKLNVEVSSVTGTVNIGGINQPIISQRKIEHDIRLKEGEASILGGLIQRTDTKSLNGWPGLASIPFVRYFFADNRREIQEDEVLIVLTPHIIRLPSITAENLQTLAAGTDTNVRVYREETGAPATTPGPAKPGAAPVAPSAQVPTEGGLRFEPATVELKKGDTATVALVADNVKDLFSIPLLLQYDPAVIQIDDVRNGGFLSGGTQEIAIVQRIDQQRGQAIVSATRQPNTPGVNGSGTLLGIIIRAIAPGTSKLQIVQMNARDSQQRPIPLASKEATITVQ